MRERAQASVETIALLAAAMAIAAALMLAVVRLGPPLAASIGQALSSAFGPSAPAAPGLDPLERLVLEGATSATADGPTLLDLRTHLRSRLAPPEADAAFAAILRPLTARALSADAIDGEPGPIRLIDRSTEDEWLRDRFHPGILTRFAKLALGLAGGPGAIYSLGRDVGFAADEAIAPGSAAGDVVVQIGDGLREVILRKQPGRGLIVIAERLRVQ
jgi:hypothetical protein